MVQLITFLLVVAALVTLVLQNLSPFIGLVVLGRSTLELPLAVWLLIAIAIGALCTLIIYQLVPNKRAYRPMGKRLSDPPPPSPEPTSRFMETPSEAAPNRFQSERSPGPVPNTSQNPYDSDWNDFKAPEQWDDWGQQTAAAGYESRDRRPSASTDDAMRDIESGWGEDDYETSGRYASRRDPEPDMGWDDRQGYPADSPERPSTRSYDEGWLYGNDSGTEPVEEPRSGEPQSGESDEDVYDANYRVIIPPYDPKDS